MEWFRTTRVVSLLALMTLGPGCGTLVDRGDSAPTDPPPLDSVRDAVPRNEPLSKYGNPSSYVVRGQRYHTRGSAIGYRARGVASWYGQKFHGRRTSSGEVYDMYAMTAAHKALPLPSFVEVTNLENGRRVVVRVNDRGPFHDDRIIDLSYTAAYKLDMLRSGTAPVSVRALVPGAEAVVPTQPAPVGTIYVQAGAFTDPANAERLRDELRGRFPQSVAVSAVEVAGRRLHRVRVGPFETVENADGVAAALGAEGLGDARLVVD